MRLGGRDPADADARLRARPAHFSLAIADVGDPARVAPLLAALRAQALANIDGTATAEALPRRRARRRTRKARVCASPASGPTAAVSSRTRPSSLRDLTLYQATVMGAGEPADREAIDTFFGSIRLP